MGYDVSDYRAIYPPYGTLKDVEQLITGLHARNMRLLLDLVVNHTSDQVGKSRYPLALTSFHLGTFLVHIFERQY